VAQMVCAQLVQCGSGLAREYGLPITKDIEICYPLELHARPISYYAHPRT
jgi:hypothetical protein